MEDAKLKIVTLTPVEDARWIELFTSKLNSGMACDQADEETWTAMQIDFPRLTDFDRASDATHI